MARNMSAKLRKPEEFSKEFLVQFSIHPQAKFPAECSRKMAADELAPSVSLVLHAEGRRLQPIEGFHVVVATSSHRSTSHHWRIHGGLGGCSPRESDFGLLLL